jgi:hypothetical protein
MALAISSELIGFYLRMSEFLNVGVLIVIAIPGFYPPFHNEMSFNSFSFLMALPQY